MVISSHSVYGGAFATKGRFQDQFELVDVNFNEILGIYEVTVTFNKNPEKEYVFEIDESVYVADKAKIGAEIKRQLS